MTTDIYRLDPKHLFTVYKETVDSVVNTEDIDQIYFSYSNRYNYKAELSMTHGHISVAEARKLIKLLEKAIGPEKKKKK